MSTHRVLSVLASKPVRNMLTTMSISRHSAAGNSILACDSIKSAESYYRILREMIGQREGCNLKVATIFSFAPNGADDDPNGFIDDEDIDASEMPQADREFLDGAIADYNAMFKTSFSTDAEGFDGYFVFDADNLLEPDYIEKMNAVFSGGYEIVTSYRNSKIVYVI